MKKILLAPLLLLLSSHSHGDWVSGGGKLILHANNPWFVQNTKTVSYCVIADEDAMKVSLATLQQIVTRAINYWKKEFLAVAPEADLDEHSIKIATQDFVAQLRLQVVGFQ